MKKLVYALIVAISVCVVSSSVFANSGLSDEVVNKEENQSKPTSSGGGGGGGQSRSESIAENDFYVSLSGYKVYFGGGLNFANIPSDKNYSLILGFYDGTRMIHTYMTELDKDITAFSFAEQTIRLSYYPVSITAKAFLWSDVQGCVPLCSAIAMQDNSAQLMSADDGIELFQTEITNPYLRINSAISDIMLKYADGAYYLEGDVAADISGYDMYDIVLSVKEGESNVVYEDIITADSRMNFLSVKKKLDFEPSEFMYASIGFVRNGEELYNCINNEWVKPEIIPEVELTEIYGRITAMPESGLVKFGQATLQIEYAENFEGQKIDYYNNDFGEEINVITRDDIEFYPYTYAKIALSLEQTEQGNVYTIERFEPVRTSVVKQSTSNFDSCYNSSIDFFDGSASSKTVSYHFSDAEIYVNGVNVPVSLSEAADSYIVDNANGEVILIDTPAAGCATGDGYYDCIMITKKSWAVIDSTVVSGSQNKMYFDDSEDGVGYLSLDSGDNAFSYLLKKNGENVEFDSIIKGDVVLLTYDVTGNLRDSDFVIVEASDTVVTGRVTQIRNDDGIFFYTVNGNEYTYVGDCGMYASLQTGNEYRLSLDIYGRIIRYEESDLNKFYGVIDRVYLDSNSGDYKARVIKADGTRESHVLKDGRYEANSLAYSIYESGFLDDGYHIGPIINRVVTYKLNSSSEMYSISPLSVSVATGEYNATSARVGSARMTEATQVIDLSNLVTVSDGTVTDSIGYSASDIIAASLSSFVDGEEYTLYYGDKMSDGTYKFVIILDGNDCIGVTTHFAVIDSVSEAEYTDDATTRTTISVYNSENKDELTTLFLDEDISSASLRDLQAATRGTVVVYGTNSNGVVIDIRVLYQPSTTAPLTYTELASNLNSAMYMNDPKDGANNQFYLRSGVSKWDDSNIATSNSYARVSMGAIIKKDNSFITVGQIDGNVSRGDDVQEFYVADDANVYVLNYSYTNSSNSGRLSSKSFDAVPNTYFPNQAISESVDGSLVYDWESRAEAFGTKDINYAYFKTLNGEITDILVVCDEILYETPEITPYVPEEEPPAPTEGLIEVYGRLTATPKEMKMKSGSVSLRIEYAEDFEGEKIDYQSDGSYEYADIFINDTISDAALVYGKFMLYPYSDGYYPLLGYSVASFEPENTSIVSKKASDFDSIEQGTISFKFETESYSLDSEASVYVNNIELYDINRVQDYISDNSIGSIKLIDVGGRGVEPDGFVDYVMITEEKWAVVDRIGVSDDIKAIFLNEMEYPYISSSQLNLYPNEENYHYEVWKNGSRIDFSEIMPGDVILAEFDLQNGRFGDSPYVYIDVCNTRVSGKVESVRQDEGQWRYTINGAEYIYVNDTEEFYCLSIGDSYICSLDSHGRIVAYTEDSSNKKYGVIDRVFLDNFLGDYKARVIKADGTRESYVIDGGSDDANQIASYVYTDTILDGMSLSPLADRVVEYELNSKNEIHSITNITMTLSSGEYKESVLRIGSAKMTEATQIVDLTKLVNVFGSSVTDIAGYSASDIKAASLSSFTDGDEYTIYYGDRMPDGEYGFVIIVKGNPTIDVTTHFAVIDSVCEAENIADASTRTTISVYNSENKDELTTLFLDEDLSAFSAVRSATRGTVVVYGTDGDGVVTDINVLYQPNAAAALSCTELASYLSGATYMNDPRDIVNNQFYLSSGVDSWDASNLATSKGYARVSLGAIVDKNGSDVTIAQITGTASQGNDVQEFSLANDVNVYILDYNYKNSTTSGRLSCGAAGSIIKTMFPGAAIGMANDGSDIYDWTDYERYCGTDNMNYAYFKTLNEEITDILVIIPAY